jgi:hypothetical protein
MSISQASLDHSVGSYIEELPIHRASEGRENKVCVLLQKVRRVVRELRATLSELEKLLLQLILLLLCLLDLWHHYR